MVKPLSISGAAGTTAPLETSRQIRDVHTLVAKLASEAVTLQGFTAVPPADKADEAIQKTISTFATGLAEDAVRLASSLVDGASGAEATQQSAPEASVRPGSRVDRRV